MWYANVLGMAYLGRADKAAVWPVLILTAAANLLMAIAEGRIAQFVRSGFKRLPTEQWPEQWALLAPHLFYRP